MLTAMLKTLMIRATEAGTAMKIASTATNMPRRTTTPAPRKTHQISAKRMNSSDQAIGDFNT